ncbi:hypothetical protein AB0H43_10540 [Hamadaea sp. NPDC050747]|uniref:hypothetical protein n=1 Tax=Hamadaea sp. NPDC050747 TaxID=3155789 RepID=UPI0033F5A4E2
MTDDNMNDDLIDLPLEVPFPLYAQLTALSARKGLAVREMALALLTVALVPAKIPEDADATLIAAARAFLAGDFDAITNLLADVDARLLLGTALGMINSVGLTLHDGDHDAWDAELLRGLQGTARPGDIAED